MSLEADQPDDVALPAGPSPAEWDLKQAAIWLIVGAGLFNFFSFPLLRGLAGPGDGAVVLVGLMLGVYPAQLGALTLWLVWGQGSFLWRLALHWAVGLGLFVAWAIGCAAAFGDMGPSENFWEVLGAVVASLPLVGLAAQLPMWPLRTHLGWRVESPHGRPDFQSGPSQDGSFIRPNEPVDGLQIRPMLQPLSIRDFLVGTVATAVALAGIRLTAQFVGGPDTSFWVGWAVAVASIAGISLLALLPAVCMLLRIRDTGSATMAWFCYAAGWWLITLIATGAISRSSPPGEVVVGMICVFVSFAITLGIPLWIVRARGWRLILPRDEQGRRN